MTNLNPPVLLDPWEYEENLPTKLSPSSLNSYLKCPQSWFFIYMLGQRDPGSPATLRGSMFHFAAERAFDLPPEDRTTANLTPFLHQYWAELTEPDVTGLDAAASDKKLVAADNALSIAEKLAGGIGDLFAECEVIINNWLAMEPVQEMVPQSVPLPSGEVIDGREIHVEVDLGEFVLHGFIDRLDSWTDEDGVVHYRVCDYKTSAKIKDKYLGDHIRQQRIYGWLLWEMYGIEVEELRLVFPAVGGPEAFRSFPFTPAIRDKIKAEVLTIREKMRSSANAGLFKTKQGPLCGWCPFQEAGCPAPGVQTRWRR